MANDYYNLLGALSKVDVSNWAAAYNKLARQGLYYCRRRINLDSLTFTECSFENCEFYTETGSFSLIRCRIYGPQTQFIYGGQALKIAKLYEFMNSSINNRLVFPQIYPEHDSDGRITI